jgi:catechol 2,3-dioxygenase-like lactoylglutathione lyase family enzyme
MVGMIKAVSALRLAVADPPRSVEFYKTLGFLEIPGDGPSREVRSNWFRIRFEKREAERGSAGVRICLSVDDIDACAATLEANGIRPTREPAGKSQELVVLDPDHYSLLFFATKGSAQKGEASHRPTAG